MTPNELLTGLASLQSLDAMRKRVSLICSAYGDRKATIELSNTSEVYVYQNAMGVYNSPKINWSSGNTKNIATAEGLALALLVLVEIAKEWDKDTGKDARTNAAT